MSNSKFTPPPVIPGEQDGFTNHVYRLSSPLPEEIIQCPAAMFNRVIVVAPKIEDVKSLQALLPKFFQALEPISLLEATEQDIRPEPGRLLHVTREDLRAYAGKYGGYVFFLAYSIFEYIEGYGCWTDLRDLTSCKWGRQSVPHAPGRTLSENIMRGETTIEKVKADCGFE